MPKQKVIFDVETTGLNPAYDEILQFSAINGSGKVLLNTYIKPARHKSWPQAQAIHGISPTTVLNAPRFSEVRGIIQNIFDSASELIGYNMEFDIAFLEAAGIEIPFVKQTDVMLEFADVYGEYSDYFGDYKWQKLRKAAEYYGYRFNAHDSLEDVKATLFVYNAMRK